MLQRFVLKALFFGCKNFNLTLTFAYCFASHSFPRYCFLNYVTQVSDSRMLLYSIMSSFWSFSILRLDHSISFQPVKHHQNFLKFWNSIGKSCICWVFSFSKTELIVTKYLVKTPFCHENITQLYSRFCRNSLHLLKFLLKFDQFLLLPSCDLYIFQ